MKQTKAEKKHLREAVDRMCRKVNKLWAKGGPKKVDKRFPERGPTLPTESLD